MASKFYYPSSKTDQIHEEQYCAIPRGNHELCPVRSLENWLSMALIDSGAIFRRVALGEHIGDHALTPLSVNHILKHRAAEAGLTDTASQPAPPEQVPHSMPSCVLAGGSRPTPSWSILKPVTVLWIMRPAWY